MAAGQSARADSGGGVLLERESVTLLSSPGDASSIFGSLDVSSRAAIKGRRANFRLFLEKLEKRRKRIPCSYSCKSALRDVMLKIRRTSGHVHHEDLRELLRQPPKGVPLAILRDLVGVSQAYDCTGEKQIDMFDLLDRALEVQPLMSTRMCVALQVALVMLWFSVSPVMYCYFADWTFLDAMYYSIMTLTTVGSNDVFPEGYGLKVFAVLYLLFGYVLVAWVLVSCIVSLVIRYENFVRSLFIRRDMDLLADAGHGASSKGPALEHLTCGGAVRPAESTADQSTQHHLGEVTSLFKAARARQAHHMRAADKAITCLAVILAMLALGACLFYLSAEDSETPITDALYWSLATCSTIGVSNLQLGGDDVRLGRGLAAFFVAVAVPACMIALFELGEAHLQICSAQLEARVKSRVLEDDALIDMDANGVGVNQVEFLCAMLLAHDKVSGSDLWHVLNKFAVLDFDGSGMLDSNKLMALRRDVSKNAETESLSRRPTAPMRCLPCFGRRQQRSAPRMSPDQKALHPPVATLPVPAPADTPASEVGDMRSGLKMLPMGTTDFESGAQAALASTASTALPPVEEGMGAVAAASTADFSHEGLTGGTAAVSIQILEELYQENAKIRRQLDARSEELVAAFQSRQHIEQALRQVWAERQALHGEVRLLQHKAAECETRCEAEMKRQEAAEARRTKAEQLVQDAERRVQEAEQRRHDSEQARVNAEQRASQAEQLRAEAEAKARQADERADAAEQRAVELIERLRDAEQEWRLQSETKARELELKTAEMDMRRQGEVRSALLELQALAQGQQVLRQEMHRVRPPPTLAYVAPSRSGTNTSALRLRSGQQPWEVWERASTWAREAVAQREGGEAPQTALLSGRVREQIEFLDRQVRELEKRHVSKEQSMTQPPGWV